MGVLALFYDKTHYSLSLFDVVMTSTSTPTHSLCMCAKLINVFWSGVRGAFVVFMWLSVGFCNKLVAFQCQSCVENACLTLRRRGVKIIQFSFLSLEICGKKCNSLNYFVVESNECRAYSFLTLYGITRNKKCNLENPWLLERC